MNINKFKELLAVQSVSYNQKNMIMYLEDELRELGVSFKIKDENIFVEKGKGLRPCIVSHIDTVHPITTDLYPLQIGDNITGFNRKTLTQVGIGGDDKVGIWICLEALRTFDNIKVVFFSNEEVGCKGSYSTSLKFFNDCTFVLQCDRQGNKDFVDNACGVELSSKHFQDCISHILDNHGYSFSDGGMTDVMALKENGLSVCCANMSCGYYNPHRANEYINIQDVDNAQSMVFQIISEFGDIKFTHKYDYVPYKYEKVKTIKKSYKPKYLSKIEESHGVECNCDNCGSVVEFSKELDDYFCGYCMMYGKELTEYFEKDYKYY